MLSIEILDRDGKRPVFGGRSAAGSSSKLTMADRGRSKGYRRLVRRSELQASPCVHDDSIVVSVGKT